MDSAAILEELLNLLEEQNVKIRRDSLGGSGGGLCNIKGQNIFYLDTQSSSAESAAKCAEALAKVADIERLYIKPQVREMIEKYTKTV
jgi:hypothetical protein